MRPVEHGDALAMFEASARARPDEVAVRYFDNPISFRRLDELSNAFASALRERGVKPGDRVASFLQNVPQAVITLLATWKAGGISVAVGAMAKQPELEHHLADSGAVALVTLESLWHDVARDVVPRTAVTLVVTTSEVDFLGARAPVPEVLRGAARRRDTATEDLVALVESDQGRRLQRPCLGPDDVALLTYTSGTTGPPKGAMNTHANVVFNACTYRDWVGLGHDDVILGIAPLFHVTGIVGHMAVGFLTGAELLLSYRFDPGTLLAQAERHRATFTVGAITALVALVHHPQLDRHDVSSLTKIYSGGAPIAPAVADEIEARLGSYVHNIYGLTETTSPSHAVPFGIRAPVDPATGALSVGVPVSGTEARIVDPAGEELAAGDLGELVVSGPQVVPGYWNQPEESAHALRGGELWTGDVGFVDAEGWFYVVDRNKDQINASGYKVWPREVEDVLYRHPAVREAAVVGVPDAYRGETVRAYVSLKPGAGVAEAELIDFCRERLAAYKYPRGVEVLDDLPKTATGKILRRELRGAPTADPPGRNA